MLKQNYNVEYLQNPLFASKIERDPILSSPDALDQKKPKYNISIDKSLPWTGGTKYKFTINGLLGLRDATGDTKNAENILKVGNWITSTLNDLAPFMLKFPKSKPKSNDELLEGLGDYELPQKDPYGSSSFMLESFMARKGTKLVPKAKGGLSTGGLNNSSSAANSGTTGITSFNGAPSLTVTYGNTTYNGAPYSDFYSNNWATVPTIKSINNSNIQTNTLTVTDVLKVIDSNTVKVNLVLNNSNVSVKSPKVKVLPQEEGGIDLQSIDQVQPLTSSTTDNINKNYSVDTAPPLPDSSILQQSNAVKMGEAKKLADQDKAPGVDTSFLSNQHLNSHTSTLDEKTGKVDVKKAGIELAKTAGNVALGIGKVALQEGIKAASKEAAKGVAKEAIKLAGLSAAGSAAKSALSGLGGVNIGLGLATAAVNMLSDKVQKQSSTTKVLNNVYDGITAAVNFVPVAGLVVSTILAANKLLTDSMTAAGAGTDLITLMDQIMDSAFLKTTIGLPNALGALKLPAFRMDREAIENVGDAYKTSAKAIEKAHVKSGKKVGLYNDISSMRAEVAKAASEMLKISEINKEHQTALAMQSNPQVANREELARLGGVKGVLQAAKKGAKLYDRETALRILKYKKGNDLLSKKSDRSLKELIEYAKEKNPRFVQRMSEPIRFITWTETDQDGYDVLYSGTHELSYADGKVFPMILDINGKLVRFTEVDAALLSALLNGNYLEMSPEEAELFTVSNNNKEGYKTGWPEFFKELPSEFWDFWETLPKDLQNNDTFNMYEYWNDNNQPKDFEQAVKDGLFESSVELFRKGGSFNVVPEGALHKNRHRLENIDEKFKEVTTKGIPVVSEEGGSLVQHAEVEKEEIILRYEVTRKIEKLMNENTDEAAVKAGELLVYEILYNTIDNTKRMI